MTLVWLRRDLRLEDNTALYHALRRADPVLCMYIWDPAILATVRHKDNGRVTFIHRRLEELDRQLQHHGSRLLVAHGDPQEVLATLHRTHPITALYWNKDYEPGCIQRDGSIHRWCSTQAIPVTMCKDHVIFEEQELRTGNGGIYTVYTPYSKKWKQTLAMQGLSLAPSEQHLHRLLPASQSPQLWPTPPTLEALGCTASPYPIPPATVDTTAIAQYHLTRDIPALPHGTSRLGVHLRFGTISIRHLVDMALHTNETFLNELIWRDFYHMILSQFPHVVTGSFRPVYDRIPWRNNLEEFQAWQTGHTGYPLVDAGMRQLLATGYMHNRVRMVTASFLTKHLLIDWRWGEQFFADYLLDYELAANNGGWQWAAGSGCDAAPYFRVFNPTLQEQRFDPEGTYIRHWIPELETLTYPHPMVEHKQARDRAILTYKTALTS